MDKISSDRCASYLLSQTERTQEANKPPLRAITISRETGTGAARVGHFLADYMQEQQKSPQYPWAVFDRELVERVLKDHQLPKRLEQFMVEDATYNLKDTVEELLGVHPSSWTLVQQTVQTILRLALAGNVILIGRGANVITAHLPHVFHVRLVAPLEQRIRQIQTDRSLSRDEAETIVRDTDRARHRYVLRNFDVSADDPLQYHLTVNIGRVTPEDAARLIGDAVMRRKADELRIDGF